MRKVQQVTAANFGAVVKTWSLERFMATFKKVYPDAPLREIAAELGLKPTKKSNRK